MKRTDDPRQMELSFNFYAPPVRHSLENGNSQTLSDFDFQLRKILKQVLADCDQSREDLAKAISALLGREITKTHLDGWTAMSAVERRLHVDTMKAICQITGDNRLLHYVAESCGFKALTTEEAEFADYGAKVFFKKMIDQDIRTSFKGVDKKQLAKRLKSRAMKDGGWKS
tara:strand:+ start:1068 stop:1580 length:513 start_codon:yes stop_codon:yes gene_type:complete